MTDDPTLRFHDDAATRPTLETVLERINDFSSTEASIAEFRSYTETSISGLRSYTETAINELRVSTQASITQLRNSMGERFEDMELRIDRVHGVTLTFRSEIRELRREIKDRFLPPPTPDPAG